MTLTPTGYQYGWSDPDEKGQQAIRGLSKSIVEGISAKKAEPDWMLDMRLKGLRLFDKKPLPTWGAGLETIDFDNIKYYVESSEKQAATWEDLPPDIKNTYDKLGIPEAEKQRLVAGVAAQYESTVLYHSIREDLEEQGVIFVDTDTALREHEDLFKEYFGTVIPPGDNKFAALNTAVWSGGSFIYVPKNVHVDIPLQAYFRINTENMGQFERTLIIADEGAYVHYVEGCLPAGQLIAMGDGSFKPIETIRVHDEVLAHDGKPHKVTAVQVRDYAGDTFTVTPVSTANAFTLTPEHPVLRVAKSAKEGTLPEFVAAKELREGDFICYPKPQMPLSFLLLPLVFAKLTGYYLRYGSCIDKDTVEFALNTPQEAEELDQCIKQLYGTASNKERHATITVKNSALYSAMQNHVGNLPADRKLSADLLAQDLTFIKELLRCCGIADRHETHTASQQWAYQLQALLAALGKFATITSEAENYTLAWPKKQDGQAKDRGEYFLVPINKIETQARDELVYNLDVESPDSYLPCGFAVHNCTAPIYSTDSLHSAVVEIICKPRSRVRYTTIQNWSNNVYNLVTKRAVCETGATMEWVDGNIGSKVTMKYPAVYLMGEHAKGETLSIAMAGQGQHQDAGAKMVHAAPNTTSAVVSKSVARGGGRTSYRGLIQVNEGAYGAKTSVVCDALLTDQISRSDTYPYNDIREDDTQVSHEASVSKISEQQLFYLMSRGLEETEARAMIVRGFIEPIAKQLPMEYALELNRLIELQMEGSVG